MATIPILPTISDHDSVPARALSVELSTRITTQPLHYRSGEEVAAVTSVKNLFDTTRRLLVANPNAAAFTIAGNFLLNDILRPYTARWHGWMVDNRFVDERARRQFRFELQQLQPLLVKFNTLLESMVDREKRKDGEAIFQTITTTVAFRSRVANLGEPIYAGIGLEVPFKKNEKGHQTFATAELINEAEAEFIHKRRKAMELEEPANLKVPVKNATGLCLSGGGIRSATFCLGIVQVLQRQGLFRQFDYLSTVSGGGYLGTFLTSYLGTPKDEQDRKLNDEFDQKTINQAFDDTFQDENGHESKAIRHLRNNSRYLLTGGLWGRLKIFGLLITGILTNLLLILPIPMAAAGTVALFHYGGYWNESIFQCRFLFAESWAKNVLFGFTIFLTAFWFGLPLVRSRARGQAPEAASVKFRNGWEAIAIALGLCTLVSGGLVILPWFLHLIGSLNDRMGKIGPAVSALGKSDVLAIISAAAPVVFGLFAARLKKGKPKTITTILFTLSGPLFCLVIFLFVLSRLVDERFAGSAAAVTSWPWWGVIGVTFLLGLWGWVLVDINEFSPHRYYRARLCECYLAVRNFDQTGMLRDLVLQSFHGTKKSAIADRTNIGTRRQLPLSEINQTGAAPYHLLNTSANLPASHEPNLRGRECDFFMFSRYYCGGPVCGYLPTEALEKLDPHIDLGSAMAISGAAASSNMGLKTLREYRFLLTLLNVRLGYWMRNPIKGKRWPSAGPGPLYLFREMFGWMHEQSGYLNLSDGGHIENLAMYELLRRRCKFIVVVDGGMEPGMECADLMLAQRYAQIDFGVRIDLDIADLAVDSQRRSRAYAVFSKIRYSTRGKSPETEDEKPELGWLVYIKLACVGDEPGYVVDYRLKNPDFPHQSTADQIYDEAQFEAYRRLGECAAESLFRGELVGQFKNPKAESDSRMKRFLSLEGWFQAMANNLLPDNDPAFEKRS